MLFFFFILLIIPMVTLQCSIFEKRFSGVVVDTKGQPISNTIVCIQGTSFSTQTDKNGKFTLTVDQKVNSKYITAGKLGFYNGAQPFLMEVKKYRIVLNPIQLGDNKEYRWLPSLHSKESTQTNIIDEAKPCEACHPNIAEEWKRDAHSGSATNVLFLSFFNGTDGEGRKKEGPGYKLDFPNSNGNCAMCHVPALALHAPLNTDPNKAQGAAKEGIFCDFCHKISDSIIDNTGGNPGILSIKFQRPAEERQVFYGPYADVFPGPDGYHPLYKKSHYCAPCHHGKFWDVLAYSEFQEWVESSYKERNIHCQDCHMPFEGKMTRFALEEEGGILRDPNTIPSHVNFGIEDEAFMRAAIELSIQTHLRGETLEVTVTIKNVNAGHHYPTGNPMRNMILLVEVRDENGQVLSMTEGEKVPEWGGVGSIEDGNYAGLPGKGFAKVLKDLILYPDRQQRHFQYTYPAPHWRPTVVDSDNRIPADGSDISYYQFQISNNLSRSIHITARLIFRRTYKIWSDAKKLELPDMEIARDRLTIRR